MKSEGNQFLYHVNAVQKPSHYCPKTAQGHMNSPQASLNKTLFKKLKRFKTQGKIIFETLWSFHFAKNQYELMKIYASQ